MTRQFGAGTEREERKGRKAAGARVEADVVTRVNATVKTRAKAADEAVSETEEEKPDGAQIAAELRKAATRGVADRCASIVNGLMHKTLDGDLRCARLLFELADIHPGSKDEQKRELLESAAALLAAEPEWVEEQ